ncbi:cobaltochelatase subunit CobN [Azonexus hydrophilus]
MARLADRVKKWVTLRYELNQNKRVAVIYYNYLPGKETLALPTSMCCRVRSGRSSAGLSRRVTTPEAGRQRRMRCSIPCASTAPISATGRPARWKSWSVAATPCCCRSPTTASGSTSNRKNCAKPWSSLGRTREIDGDAVEGRQGQAAFRLSGATLRQPAVRAATVARLGGQSGEDVPRCRVAAASPVSRLLPVAAEGFPGAGHGARRHACDARMAVRQGSRLHRR